MPIVPDTLVLFTVANEPLWQQHCGRCHAGMHLLQLQSPGGRISNDFIFHVTENAEPPPAPTMGDLVHDAGWDRLLGKWVDPGTRGELQVHLDWKIKYRLLEMTYWDQNGPTVALISIDQKSGEVVHSGTNHSGTTFSGSWDFDAEGGPKMNGKFISSEGVEGDLTMQFELKDNDAMVFAIKLLDRPASKISMIRAK